MQIRELGLVDYNATAKAMLDFTTARSADTQDELWLCQHPSVYTLGVGADTAHLLQQSAIPLVKTTRGGQITHHGPGQIVAYPLVNLKRLGIFAKEYVRRLEEAIIHTLAAYDIAGQRISGAPGVYVRHHTASEAAPAAPLPDDRFQGMAKIAALGVKISKHCSYHGLALNVAMDLSPYALINPCGYAGLQTVDMHTIGVRAKPQEVAQMLAQQLVQRLCPPVVACPIDTI